MKAKEKLKRMREAEKRNEKRISEYNENRRKEPLQPVSEKADGYRGDADKRK